MSSDLEKRVDELKTELTGYKLKNKMLTQELLSLKKELAQARQEPKADKSTSHPMCSATVLAHEMNQPLTAIAAYSRSCLHIIANQLMDKDIKKHLLEPLEKIAAQAGLAGEIIHNMNKLMHAGNCNVEKTDINQLIQDTLVVLNDENAQLTIKLDLMDNPPTIMTNKIHIMQVVLNLARNSIEALNNASEKRPEITIRTTCSQGFIQVHVRDNGPGIPPKLGKKIWNNYFTTKPNGTGIGLGICCTLIEEHGGELSLHGDNNTGTWFMFTLPINTQDKSGDKLTCCYP
ncbi:sensor histidine kinase [Legionella shakespearei]|uniref:histidine kinase n=1 Tax=Legionella shakespearei DSM 23087 TaxID=1122169 RepID=A0A0W0YIU0_9GAMM|nr:HAMP domain-containing sensor histidine kinase [Legionella shakespearei]KTD56470.1 sensory histidine kinase in two-component regulatory system with QseB [Legionella shakespearei DSM 23087]